MTPLDAYLAEVAKDLAIPVAHVAEQSGPSHTLENHLQATCPHRGCQFGAARERLPQQAATLLTMLQRAREDIAWYAERAQALRRYMEATPPMASAMTAVVTELALDGGERAKILDRLAREATK